MSYLFSLGYLGCVLGGLSLRIPSALNRRSRHFVLLPLRWHDGDNPSSVHWLRDLLFGNLVRLHFKMSRKERFSLSVHIRFLQQVTSLPNSGKGGANGHILVSSPWSGKERWGRLVEWVEKAFFTRLNKLFEIDASEQNHKVLLLDKNLLTLIAIPSYSSFSYSPV
ncbi:hypothetical protein CK203_029464 [Vitis vinifera]|uniref:Uncharacterized protein n=1 Tax=Vitis vinifera TaxID=29760 RepID=A0A438JCI5_VITVI|nr:hypothetical protein CK203_029464 [Vitis vinifera]